MTDDNRGLFRLFDSYRSESSGGDATQPIYPGGLSELLGLPQAAPARIDGRWFKGEKLEIDGYAFANCRFDHCTFVVRTGNFSFASCFFSQDCGIAIDGDALRVVKLFLSILGAKGFARDIPSHTGFFAIENTDSTVTIP